MNWKNKKSDQIGRNGGLSMINNMKIFSPSPLPSVFDTCSFGCLEPEMTMLVELCAPVPHCLQFRTLVLPSIRSIPIGHAGSPYLITHFSLWFWHLWIPYARSIFDLARDLRLAKTAKKKPKRFGFFSSKSTSTIWGFLGVFQKT